MTMSDNLHQRLTLFSDLDCQVARHFNQRPALLETAADLLEEQWRQRQLSPLHNPRALYLASRQRTPGKTWIRPLTQVLVERYCQRHTLNLTPGEDALTTRLSADPAWQVDLDLHDVELLINEAAPHLLENYQQQLIAYWSRAGSDGQTPWGWYAAYLRKQLQDAIGTHDQAASLPHFALAAATLVHDHPVPSQRNAWSNTNGLAVSTLAVDFAADGKLDVDLSSAVLIEHNDRDPGRELTLLYTLTGKLLSFTSRQHLLDAIARCWPDNAHTSAREVSIGAISHSPFEAQALGLLNQQLQVIQHIAGQYRSKLDAIDMSLDLDRLTDMIDLCSSAEALRRQPLATQLPDWLRDAPSKPLLQYSTLLIDVAQGYHDVDGQFWLDGIDNAEDFANRRLAERLAADHPDSALKPEQVQVINHQTAAAAAPSQGVIVTSGAVTPVTYSLAQLAIGNLGLLKPGRVELIDSGDEPLPAWMNENHLRTLVSELDIASAYPAMLRSRLLDAAQPRAQRQRLLSAQLRTQLPALAMELYLRGKLPDPQISSHVAQVFATTAGEATSRWVMRALGFIKSPGATPDHPRNCWLIEPQAPGADACLLYRPLHEDSLLYFSDRLALFVAISTPGDLQDDLLQRLPAEDRRFYAHGGFLEPHLFVPLDDTSAVPLSTPAPVSLSVEPALDDPGATLYLACVNESIERFEAHAATTAQTRWASWKQLGWLLFNTLLPLAGGTLGKVAWLAQMEVAIADYVESDAQRNPGDHQLAMVNLLVNIAILLFSHSIFRLRLEHGEEPEVAAIPATLPEPAPALPRPIPVVDRVLPTLDFSWSRPDRHLTLTQRTALEALQAGLAPASLGAPVPTGALRGLYLHDTHFYTLLDGKPYRVETNSTGSQTRIIGPDLGPGPWLQRDEAGRWQLDLGLRLKGGMPLSEQIRKLQLNKEAAFHTANDLLSADKLMFDAKYKEMQTIDNVVSVATTDNALSQCQDKMQALYGFWMTHLEHATTRNAIQPIRMFKLVHAYALHQAGYCLRALNRILIKRFRPVRDQLLQVFDASLESLSKADELIVLRRLDLQEQLLDQRLENNKRLRQCQTELGRLASQQTPDIVTWRDLAASVPATLEQQLDLQFLQLEVQLNRLTLGHGLTSVAVYWCDRFLDNISLGIAQRATLFKLQNPDTEVAARLLRSIQEHFMAAGRHLGKVAEELPGEAAQQPLRKLQSTLGRILEQIAADLAELPDFPPVSTLVQLRNKVPGLIETAEHGLLLAAPREGDVNTVDIPGPDNKTAGRTYHLKHGNWVELKVQKAPVLPGRQKLKRLLRDASTLLAKAREEMGKLHRAADHYLPVEIEEALLHHRARLLTQAENIERRLTEDNQTDEASHGLDAERMVGALRNLADELHVAATQRRIEAAIAQQPRMGEVQFLLEQGAVQIQRMGTRTRLAKVKGRPVDYFDEYGISHQGTVLWYAHFHYPALDTPKADFTAGHLKSAAQRHVAGQRYTDATGKVVEVYRAPITSAAAGQYFFNL